ncbi:hypothetical protein D0Y65_030840 [Glycine soja]|uniref:Uncharacterized protein n=1 Tax=Glycine soja TaxID=3848 RepID=A0A445I5J6_GLYSO|nr:hypothetical protein D0Y65_030840 [Glycine soja]
MNTTMNNQQRHLTHTRFPLRFAIPISILPFRVGEEKKPEKNKVEEKKANEEEKKEEEKKPEESKDDKESKEESARPEIVLGTTFAMHGYFKHDF